jgi:serine/threonine-protein kinase RsbW
MEGRIVIRSESANLQVIDTLIEKLKECASMSVEDVFKTRLVLSEAIQNAIIHGNHSDPEKTVIIDYRYNADVAELFFCISDQGPGFNLSLMVDPTTLENREKEGGRGVYFLQAFTNGLSYCNEAKAIKFSLKLNEET